MEKTNNFPKKAVILAGGRGARLYPVTKEIPKSLLPVKRKPIINYLVDLFYSQGIKEIAVLINKDFREEFDWWQKRYYPKNNIRFVEEERPFGTFGGLFFLKDWLSDNSFFMTNGDELKKIDLKKMSEFHQKLRSPATIALVRVVDPQYYGVVICKNGKVQEFLEKPLPAQISKKIEAGKRYINSGLYLLSPEIFDYLPRGKAGHLGPKFSMIEKDTFPKLARENKLAGFKFNGAWTDCGTWQRYEKALSNWKE